MKDRIGYINRMEDAMQEKLFFVDRINLNNKIIIDFGCATGSLIKHLLNMEFENTTYIGLENNEHFFEECKDLQLKTPNFFIFSGFSEVDCWLRKQRAWKNDDREIVLICSSVFHECTCKMQKYVIGWAQVNAKYFIIRDMYWDEDTYISPADLLKYWHIVITKTNPHRLQDFLSNRAHMCERQLAEFLLKYRYIENWETEVQENYFNTEWDRIEFINATVIYDNPYTNTFIKKCVENDFDIEINWYTHRQLILEIERSE